MQVELLYEALDHQANKTPFALVTCIGNGFQFVSTLGDSDKYVEFKSTVTRCLESNRSRVVNVCGQDYFIQVFNPPLRLIIIGAVHIATPLRQIALLAGFEVTIIDPRLAFASKLRFPDTSVITDWPTDALNELVLDRSCALVTLTHDTKIDDPAILTAIQSEAFYIGCLGSRKTHHARLDRLKKLAVSDADMKRLHGPVGLDIGAKAPSEIAISIMAEITSVVHQTTQMRQLNNFETVDSQSEQA